MSLSFGIESHNKNTADMLLRVEPYIIIILGVPQTSSLVLLSVVAFNNMYLIYASYHHVIVSLITWR